MKELTVCGAQRVGQAVRNASGGNLLVGKFAATIVGDSYPMSMTMAQALFACYTDEELGRRFTSWMESRQ